MVQKMSEQQLIEKTKELAELYFKRDYEGVLVRMSPDVSWIGNGKREIYQNIYDIYRYFEEEKENCSGFFCAEESLYYVSCLTKDVGVVMASVSGFMKKDEKTTVQIPLRFTLVWKKEKDEWRVIHVHNSTSEKILSGQNDFGRAEKTAGYQIPEEQLNRVADTEQLTGIYNMEGFFKAAEQTIHTEPERNFAVVKLGIRNFRYVNRTFGYPMGDQVLKNIAKNLSASCQEKEVCGRIEKDNFAALYYYHGKEQLIERLEELCKSLLDRSLVKELGMELHFQVGVYIPQNTCQEKVINMLDKALIAQRRQKRMSGGYCTFFEKWMMDDQDEQNRMLEYAPAAMEKDEFELYIQPQFHIDTKRVVAGEALSRWNMKGERLVPPGDYIPLFEEHGFIMKFDFYMLEKLCREIRSWIDEGWNVCPISINQSRLHMQMDGYLDQFCEVVDRYQIPHKYLAFELTESAFVEQDEKMRKLANDLHEKGFLLAIDDFGTGYASLDFLSTVAADILKIDKNLLQDFDCNPRLQVILEKVVELAHQMDMVVVCEGIETENQLEYLQKLACDMGQGFLVGRPIKAREFRNQWMKLVKMQP